MKALAVAILISFLFGFLTGSVDSLRRWSRNHGTGSHSVGDWPISPQINLDSSHCAGRGDWSRTTGLYPYSSSVSFELPVSSAVLFLLARGTLAVGDVQILQASQVGDVAKVEVIVGYHEEEALHRAQVCTMSRQGGEKGVGIFTPSRWEHRSPEDMLDFRVTVHLPASPGGAPLHIQKFMTDLPNFSHQIGQLGESVHFQTISLKGSNKFIAVESLAAETAELDTSNGPIHGTFNTSSSLYLFTSNAHVKVDVGLQNNDVNRATHLTIKTSNAWIHSDVSLLSSNTTGGCYDINTETSNGVLEVQFPISPVDSTLRLEARTANAPATVVLHSAYEGAFSIHSSIFSPTLEEHPVEDPSGQRRRRIVERSRVGSGYLEGRVRYDPSGSGASSVDVRTSNAWAVLKL